LVVVDIDEKSTQALGPWPWPRERVAALLSGLDAYGVNLKVVDVLFDGALDPAQDQKLAAALKAGAPTVIAQLFALSPEAQVKSGELAGALGACGPSSAEPFTQAFGFMGAQSLFAQSSTGVGHITPFVDTDGSIRRVPAMVCYQGQAYPALALAGLAAATGAQPVVRTNKPGPFDSSAPKTIDVGGFQLPVDAQGQMRVSYQMPRAGFASVSAVDVLLGKVPQSLLKGAWLTSSTFQCGSCAQHSNNDKSMQTRANTLIPYITRNRRQARSCRQLQASSPEMRNEHKTHGQYRHAIL
jgi:adenylate cyclase